MIPHTPGPWVLEDNDLQRKVFVASRHLGYPTYIVSFGQRSNWDAVDEANARLIAAAPELLEALNALLDYSPDLDTPSEIEAEKWVALKEHARSIVAKVKGESK